MANSPREKQEMRLELDLNRYELSHLKDSPIHSWQDSDIEKLIDAYTEENIAPALYGLTFTPENVRGLLAMSYCRRCGRCCLPNPAVPEHPGVKVYEEDLRKIAENSPHSYKYLKKKSPISSDPSFIRGRYLPLPCIFYDRKNSECRVYENRPLICSTFPVTDIPGQEGTAVNVGCDYGKDIYRSILKHMNKRRML